MIKIVTFFIILCATLANSNEYTIFNLNGKNEGSYKGELNKSILAEFAQKNHGSILVNKNTTQNPTFITNSIKFNSALINKAQRTFDIVHTPSGEATWLEVEKNEIIKICVDRRVPIWESSLYSQILNDSCLVIQAPALISVDTLKVHFVKDNSSYDINYFNVSPTLYINLVTGMKYLNFKNEEVLLGYNQYDKEMLAASPFLFKNNDPERKAVILGTYLVDKYPVTNCEFTQLMWDSIPAKSSHLVKYHENIQQNWVLRKNNSIRNGSCLQNDSAANMVYLHQSMKYANERSKREGLKPYYLFSSINADGEEILSKGNYIIASWDFSKHEQSYIKVTIDTSSDGYRLPYYDEWMMLARGGDKKKKAPWDKDSLTTFEDASKHAIFATAKKKFDSEPVGQRQPNGYGLYDIFGLVEEHVLFEENNLFPHYGLHPACLKGGNNRVVRNSDDKKDDFEFEPAWSEINYGYVVPNWGPALAGFRLIRKLK